jgi:radical SAM protein with 4Fe4S-binding SPASM domain
MNGLGQYLSRKEENKKLNFDERALEATVITSLPLVAKIEVTNRCNLQCIMCRDGSRHTESKDLAVQTFMKLEPLFPTLLSAYLYGIGEVLTYPHLPEMIETLLGYDVNVGLITNGTLIRENMAKMWVENGLYKLSISIDGATKETYEKIRRGASFERLMSNLQIVRDLKRAYGSERPYLTFNYVVMRDSIAELPRLVDLAAEYGAKEVIVNDLIVFFDAMKSQALDYTDPLCVRFFSEAEERARVHGVQLFLPCAYRFKKEKERVLTSNTPRINICTEPWSGFWLTADGEVTPCCYWMNPMGNLQDHDFSVIWNNQKYQALRRVINTPKRSSHCKQCAIAGMERRSE